MKVLDIELNKIEEPDGVLRVEPSDKSIVKLAGSIKQIGLINPITVKALDGGKYEVIAGHRRFLACKSLGLKSVSCSVVTKDEKATDAIKVTENIQRKNLTDFEGIMAIANYITKHKLSLNESAEIFQSSKQTIQKYVTLANAPEDLQIALHNGAVKMEHALELMKIEDNGERLQWTQQCQEYKWSAAQLKRQIEIRKATAEFNKAFDQNRDKINAQITHMTEYITCNLCGKEIPVEQAESVIVCPDCLDALGTVRLQNKIEQEKRRQEAQA